MLFDGKSWFPTIGGIICLIGAVILLWKMINIPSIVDEEHIALFCVCIGGGGGLLKAKQNNVSTNPVTGKNEFTDEKL
jgi:hypothetical protein